MKRGGFLKVGAGRLRQFFDVQGAASVAVSCDEMFSSTDKFRFCILLYSNRFGLYGRLRFGNQLGTERSGESVLRGFGHLLFALDVDGRFLNFWLSNFGKSDGTRRQRNNSFRCGRRRRLGL